MREFDRIMAIARHPEFVKEYGEFEKENRRNFNSNETYALGKKMSAKWGFHPIIISTTNHFFLEKGIESKSWKASPVTIRNFNKDSQKLHLIIDVSRKQTEIMMAFTRTLKDFLPAQKVEKRDKGNTVSPWKVYDMVKGGKNLNKVAQELSGIKGNPSYDADLMKWYRKVERAYKKAEGFINRMNE